jgi:hypothetical protein
VYVYPKLIISVKSVTDVKKCRSSKQLYADIASKEHISVLRRPEEERRREIDEDLNPDGT